MMLILDHVKNKSGVALLFNEEPVSSPACRSVERAQKALQIRKGTKRFYRQ